MSLPVTDTFTGSVGGALTSNWTTDAGSVLLNGSNQATGQTGSHSFIRWTADTFPDDQYCQMATYATGLIASGPTVRAANTGGGRGYVLQSYDGITYLQRFSGGGASFTLIAALGAVASGDVLKITAVGSTITAFKNGVALGAFTDATYSTGSAGANFYISASIDNFEAGSLSGGGDPLVFSGLLLGVG